MPTKGMRSICFNPKTSSYSFSRTANNSPSRPNFDYLSTPRRSFNESTIEQIIEAAAVPVMKWDPDSSTYARVTSLFHESKIEAMEFIKCVNNLQKAMHILVAEDSSSHKLTQAQTLMQIAMKRLQKEFYQILSTNRAQLDPESVSTRSSRTSARSSTSEYEDNEDNNDDVRVASNSISEVEEVSSIAMADLKSIADCMISSGYAKECIHIYKLIRKSIIDEGIYRLGVKRASLSQINKMDWEVLELKIKNWLEAVRISMKTLFNGERILSDHVFASSDSIRESCFAHISKEGATLLFGFPELVLKSKKFKSIDKVFRLIDMYTAIAENWPEIESIFSFESTIAVRTQALNSLIKLGESVRSMTSEFESTIQKDSSKLLVKGGGVHQLTINTMNYLSLLADYSSVLADIFSDWSPPGKSLILESSLYINSPDSNDHGFTPALAWLILVLLCKLDEKAKYYKDVSLSYLFLANNLQHVVKKVRTSNLQYLLGDDWIKKQEAKVRQFAANYERLAWGEVLKSLPESSTTAAVEISPGKAKECFRNFQLSFEHACKKQSSWVVPDPNLRDEIRVSLARKLVAVYREFYDKYKMMVRGGRNTRVFVRITPEDVGNCLSDLFFGMTTASESGSMSESSTTTSLSPHRRRL